jgi:acyl carrier protein
MNEAVDSVKMHIRDYILEAINIADLDDDDNLFTSGIVNSLFAVQLISFLEKTFHIEVTSEDLEMENFKSISAAASFVMRKQSQ